MALVQRVAELVGLAGLAHPGGGRRRLRAPESWRKWSFPFTPLSQGSGNPSGWSTMHQEAARQRVSFASARSCRAPGLGPSPVTEEAAWGGAGRG